MMGEWQFSHDNNKERAMSKVAVWCVISPKNANPKQFGLAVAVSAKPATGDTVTAYNRHGASQVKVLGAVATNADGSPMTRSMATNIDGIPTVIQQAVFQVG
jgi:hypothetical protein